MMKSSIKNIIPKYAIIPLISALLMNSVAYYGNKIFTNDLYHYNLSIGIDKIIPFCSFFVFFYVIAYVYWVVGYIIIARENKETCYKFVSADLIAKALCLVIFIFLPTTMIRPTITENSIWGWIVKIIYVHDAPINLFPSIHCLESWICFRGALSLKKTPKWYPLICFILTILICLSTVLIKQHVFVDIFGGILVAEIGIQIVNFIQKRKRKREAV